MNEIHGRYKDIVERDGGREKRQEEERGRDDGRWMRETSSVDRARYTEITKGEARPEASRHI